MYKCEICKAVSRPGQTRRTHLIMRDVPKKDVDDQGRVVETTRKEIAREVTVCGHCFGMLGLGCTYEQVVKQRGRRPEPTKAETVVVEAPEPEIKVIAVLAPPPRPRVMAF